MSKRIKRVFTNSNTVLHMWSNQTQSDARTKNVYFNGVDVYSYGRHYLLGRIHTLKNGTKVAVINSTQYSVTTARHQRSAWSATNHLIQVWSSNPTSIETGIRETQDSLINEMFNHFNKIKFYDWLTPDKQFKHLLDDVNEFNATCDAVNLKQYKLDVNDEYKALYIEHINARLKRDAELNTPEMIEKREQQRIAKIEKQRAKDAIQRETDIKLWLSGGSSSHFVKAAYPQIIRVQGDEVQTSRGAVVKLENAVKMLYAINAGKAKSGMQIDGFKLRGILMRNDKPNHQVVQIGCHTLDLTQARETLSSYLKESTYANTL